MNKLGIITVFFFLSTSFSYANCNLTQFRWQCEQVPKPKPTQYSRSLVYCGNTPVYMSKKQYEILRRYQRANINLTLKYKGQYITSPCMPAGRRG